MPSAQSLMPRRFPRSNRRQRYWASPQPLSCTAPEARARNRLSRIPHPTAGAVPNIEPPIKMSLTPTVNPVAAPLLGQHTKDVLRDTLGYDEPKLAALEAVGAFGKAAGARGK